MATTPGSEWRIVSVQSGAQRGSEWFPVPLSSSLSGLVRTVRSASALRDWGHQTLSSELSQWRDPEQTGHQ